MTTTTDSGDLQAERYRGLIAIESIAMIGVDHHTAPLSIREALSISSEALPQALSRLTEVAQEGFILSTCNRTEVYASFDPHMLTEPLHALLAPLPKLPRHEVEAVTTLRIGRRAVEHFFSVSTGLNSMMIGEPQILTQLRTALDAARAAGALGPVLSKVGDSSLRVGKRARTETGITRNGHSIPHAAREQIVRYRGGHERQSVVIVGAGQMAGHTARLLRSAGIGNLMVLNRSELRAEALAHAVGGRFGPLNALKQEVAHADVIVSAVSASDGYILDESVLSQRPHDAKRPLLVIDLGVPRSVDPALRDHAGIRLIDIDDLGHSVSDAPPTRAADIAAMTRMVVEETDRVSAWLEERAAASTIALLRERAEQIRVREVERAMRRLGALSERDRQVVVALSVGLVGKLLHQPIVRLKEDRAGLDAAVQRLFGLD